MSETVELNDESVDVETPEDASATEDVAASTPDEPVEEILPDDVEGPAHSADETVASGDDAAAVEATDVEATDVEATAAETEAAEATTPDGADDTADDTAGDDAAAGDAAGDDTAGDDTAADDAAAEDDVTAEPDLLAEPEPASPYDLPGDWYVIHSYSGYENKVKANLETRTQSMHLTEKIFDVVIPLEDVVEIKNGKKVTVQRKMFPGYILCRMYLDDDSWYAVRNTPGVTGFVGSGTKPVPLSRREVEKFLGVKKAEEEKAPRFKPEWEIGDSVRVVVGPFADFNGVIESINLDQSKVVVLVNIFGRDTPVELGFTDIQKN